MVTKIFRITDMHCTSCSINIDGEIEDTGKVKNVKTNYARSRTEVTFDPSIISEKEIIKTIKKAGYTAVVQE